jgi:hypothetical protein
MLVSSLPYNSSMVKMVVIRSSESRVNFHLTTRRYAAGDTTLHRYHCENLKSSMGAVSSSESIPQEESCNVNKAKSNILTVTGLISY